ncbi:50S ribosomal protein L10 [Spectribacter hydrogenoxidans]|uniref:Large ribosomal subunit protein uL10 n=1 Tax=Spectribacter hydrogenoxidans TaxID=3075608 RepID=A0ABU3C3L2_9GAMM|nr:50S ribosomal protein L10 [Salinisphaera sp. W335]MDT0636152.1 50S ribosomal protein L10 [Salinisphaera sp. W335]
MAMSYEAKKAMVAEVSDVAGRAHSAVLAEYRGMTAGQMDDLRVKAREGGAYLKVVKNNLARIALKGTDYECMNDAFVGPVILGFSLEDPGSAARVISGFMKGNQTLKVTAIAFSGQMLPGEQLDRLAKLPTRDEALAQLMGVMTAPITKLVRTTREPVAQVARATAAVRDQKQAA